MPIYIYRCDMCDGEFEIRHGMFHKQHHCILCHRTECLVKVPSFRIGGKQTDNKTSTQPGKLVDEYIKDVKEEVKKEKKRLQSEEL